LNFALGKGVNDRRIVLLMMHVRNIEQSPGTRITSKDSTRETFPGGLPVIKTRQANRHNFNNYQSRHDKQTDTTLTTINEDMKSTQTRPISQDMTSRQTQP
jgi:hypothetical protein